MRLNYMNYESIVRGYVRKDIHPKLGKRKLALLLLESAFEDKNSLDLDTVREGGSDTKYRKGERNISEEFILPHYSNPDKEKDKEIHDRVSLHFSKKIKDYLTDDKEKITQMISRFRALIEAEKKTRLLPENEEERQAALNHLLELAQKEPYTDFLAETFIYAVHQKNDWNKAPGRFSSNWDEDASVLTEPPQATVPDAKINENPPMPAQTKEKSLKPSVVVRPKLYIVPKPDTAAGSSRRNNARKHIPLARFLARHKKAIAISLAILILLAGTGIFLLGFFARGTDRSIVPDFDRHVLLQMELEQENAVHYYGMGLNNWRRLEYAKAEEEITRALGDLSKYEGQAEMDIARMNNSLGCLYLDMGKYEEAGKLLNSSYHAFRQSFGDTSIEVRAVKASLAQYDFYMGNYDRALKETEEIIELSNPKKDKAIIATTSHFRATVLNSLGRYDEALALYGQVLDLYGDIEQNKSQSMNLAQYTNDSTISDAKREYYKTAARWVVLSYANMGATHLKAGDAEAAREELTKALEYCLNTWFIGQKTLMTADIYRDLAVAKHQLSDIRGAADDAEKAILVQRYLFDFEDNYPGLAQSYLVQADIFAATDSEKALSIYIKAVELAERFFGEQHPQTAAACQALGNFYLGQEDYAQALEYLERALAIRSSLMLMNNMDALPLYRDLQRAADALGYENTYANDARALEESLEGR